MDNDGETCKIYVGRVKWYDYDRAVGFIQEINTMTGMPVVDVFVHKSEIRSKHATYNSLKLLTGEIVQFSKKPPLIGTKQARATNVTGFMNGPLLCDFGNVEMTNYTYYQTPSKSF